MDLAGMQMLNMEPIIIPQEPLGHSTFSYRRFSFTDQVPYDLVEHNGKIMASDMDSIMRIGLPGTYIWPEEFTEEKRTLEPSEDATSLSDDEGSAYQQPEYGIEKDYVEKTEQDPEHHFDDSDSLSIMYDLPGRTPKTFYEMYTISEGMEGRQEGRNRDEGQSFGSRPRDTAFYVRYESQHRSSGWQGSCIETLLAPKDQGAALGDRIELVSALKSMWRFLWRNKRTFMTILAKILIRTLPGRMSRKRRRMSGKTAG
ncbi:hypothetical protein C8J56DRAFT_1033007 [Mycena floridula]|nr:hypothetical protein C8J56DRAFT_1033007 [Mycena floridula]